MYIYKFTQFFYNHNRGTLKLAYDDIDGAGDGLLLYVAIQAR